MEDDSYRKKKPPNAPHIGLYETTIELNEASGISHRICPREMNAVQSYAVDALKKRTAA
jgi:hypothetical protein